jgi:hypothetical protein
MLMAEHITDSACGRTPWYYSGTNGQRGMHFNGKTYFCFQAGDPDWLDPYVMSYDHNSGSVKGPVKVGDNPLSKHNDYHGNPGLIVDHKGYIHIIYGGHGHFRGKMRHAVSARPEDISQWNHLKNINPEATYPTLIKLSDGTILYFYRAGNHREDWVYIISKDNGRTFGREYPVMRAGTRRDDSRHYEKQYFDSWYGNFFKGRGDTIHYVTRYHACARDYRTDYHRQRRVHVYYLRRDPDGSWRNISGDKLNMPIDLRGADKLCRIWKSEPSVGKGSLIKVHHFRYDTDAADNPYILFSYGQTKSGRKNRQNLLAIANRDQGRFAFQKAPRFGVLAVKGREGFSILHPRHLYVTLDSGKTWAAQDGGFDAPVSRLTPLSNPHPDARILATESRPFSNKRRIKLFLWGDQGFVTP